MSWRPRSARLTASFLTTAKKFDRGNRVFRRQPTLPIQC
jgi:hypothetical protein